MHSVPSFVKQGNIKHTPTLYKAQVGTEVKCTQQASENGYLLMTGLLYCVFRIFFDVWVNLDYLVGCSDPGEHMAQV